MRSVRDDAPEAAAWSERSVAEDLREPWRHGGRRADDDSLHGDLLQL